MTRAERWSGKPFTAAKTTGNHLWSREPRSVSPTCTTHQKHCRGACMQSHACSPFLLVTPHQTKTCFNWTTSAPAYEDMPALKVTPTDTSQSGESIKQVFMISDVTCHDITHWDKVSDTGRAGLRISHVQCGWSENGDPMPGVTPKRLKESAFDYLAPDIVETSRGREENESCSSDFVSTANKTEGQSSSNIVCSLMYCSS